MRFRTQIRNITTFTKLTQSICSIGKLAWFRLSEDEIRIVVHDLEGTQFWATLTIPTLFEDYSVTSNNNNVIHLEIPLQQLHRALRSCATASEAILRLSKRASDNIPILSLTITTTAAHSAVAGPSLVTQEIPVRVLAAPAVNAIREPHAPQGDVSVYLPPLSQLRGIVDRFNKLSAFGATSSEPHRLEVSANAAGTFRIALKAADVDVQSQWERLKVTPETEASGREKDRFAVVRIDGRDWVKVLRIGSFAKRVVACFCEGFALVFYVFLTAEGEGDDTVLTYYMSSFSD
ncbi:checkpoint protein Hus1/Mec3 [Sphaerosporella brunnea]|uniref:Checkpoint protein n=1 Tax=Sphaerosporella brunnea TaxID=1250544 RepID=A0A5J5EKZ3_9PEZI|nr:checkpoint protein Hus1/Mec3 [Sphaerosporella brunnea]